MIIVHVYDAELEKARKLFPEYALRGDLYDFMRAIDDDHISLSYLDVAKAGFMNFLSQENA